MKTLINPMRIMYACFLLCLALSGSAQVEDSFTDGDFTENPAWEGDTDDFEVNTAGCLQLRATGADTSMLSTALAVSGAMEWKGWFRLAFAPSDNNYFRFYLSADRSDLKRPLNGYFLRYGENGTADGLDLWRQDGTSLFKIWDSPSHPNAAAGDQRLRFKVTRSPAGEWRLWVDYSGGYAYRDLGGITDSTYNHGLSVGVWCKYTASNSSRFYVDDIYAGEPRPDTVAPMLTRVRALSADTVLLSFSEPVTELSALNRVNYHIVPGIGHPWSLVYLPPDRVKLILSPVLQSGELYTLSVDSVMDFSGNVSTHQAQNFMFYDPVPYDILIHEIMADPVPAVGLPEVEYVELYNRTNFPVDLTGWKIKVGNSLRILPGGTIPADSFLLLTAHPLPAEFAGLSALALPSFPALNNTGATVSLLSPGGTEIHRVSYTANWYRDTRKDDGGWSLEMKNPQSFCHTGDNWGASEDLSGGTPGRQNSLHTDVSLPPFGISSFNVVDFRTLRVFFTQIPAGFTIIPSVFTVDGGIGSPDSVRQLSAVGWELYFANPFAERTTYQFNVSASLVNCMGEPFPAGVSVPFFYTVPVAYDVIFSEIMADPTPVVGLPDVEYLELYNRSGFPVDVTGWKIRAGSSLRTIPGGIIPADSFLLLAPDPLPVAYSILNATAVPSFPSLSNSGATVVLYSASEREMDRVSYDLSWYVDPLKDDGGWALERIDRNNLCGGKENWIASRNDFGGTPGTRNSVDDTQTVPFGILSVAAVSAHETEVLFNRRPDTTGWHPGPFWVEGIGTPDSLSWPDNNRCRLRFSSPFAEKTTYVLQLTDTLTDCAGQTFTGSTTRPFMFYVPQQNDVVISEIFADEMPIQGLPPFEYVELYNRAPLAIPLNGWHFSAGQTQAVLPPYMLEAGRYVTLTVPQAVAEFGANTLGVPGFPLLTNTGTDLLLRKASGEPIHSIRYSDTWHTETVKRNGGWSLEMTDTENPCAGKENWTSSVNPSGGTPGAENSVKRENPDRQKPFPLRVGIPSADSLSVYFSESLQNGSISVSRFSINQGIGRPLWAGLENANGRFLKMKLDGFLQTGIVYELTFSDSLADCAGNPLQTTRSLRFALPEPANPGDVLLNEVLFDPKGNGKDYVELFNHSSKALDIQRLYIGGYDSLTGQILGAKIMSVASAILMPGEYLLLSEDVGDILNRYYSEDPSAFWEVSSLPSLPNGGGSLALADPAFRVLDGFAFTDDYHFSLLANREGVALERINFAEPTALRQNWTSAASSVGYGTPGYRNSQQGMAAESEGTLTLSPEVFSPDQDGYEDLLFIGYAFPEPGNVIHLTIYDETGRLVKKLVKGEYVGTEGNYVWDGGTESGLRPKVGIYLVLLEWFNAQGKKGKARKAVVLGTKL